MAGSGCFDRTKCGRAGQAIYRSDPSDGSHSNQIGRYRQRGVAIGICAEFKLPIRFVGVGEGMEQLQVFDKEAFVDGLFEQVS